MGDEVNIHFALRKALGFGDNNENSLTHKQGTGQNTSFQMLGLKEGNILLKPDGWYVPVNKQTPAMVVELKSDSHSIDEKDAEKQLLNYINVLAENDYEKTIGLLYNGKKYRLWINGKEVNKLSNNLPSMDQMVSTYFPSIIDRSKLYAVTRRINNNLHFNFGVDNLYQRMILTACFLVAKNAGANLNTDPVYPVLKAAVQSKLQALLQEDEKKGILLELLNDVRMNKEAAADDIIDFLSCVNELNKLFAEDSWRGEDLMGIFYNEFYRYEHKSQNGQVLTPHQTVEFLLESLDINSEDVVLDATCGTGGFLSLAMYNMIEDAGGRYSHQVEKIKSSQLYGIDNDKTMVALATATMLIHKDGKSNIHFMNAISEEAGRLIKEIKPTKVPMNPPYEEVYGCSKIVKNVIDNAPRGCRLAFILPDRKFCVKEQVIKNIMKNNHLDKIIKLPENTFNAGVSTSIFYFTAGKPQNGDKIFTCYMEDDGLCTVKNEARQDLEHKWPEVKKYWLDVLRMQDTSEKSAKWIDPKKDEICYPVEIEAEPLTLEDTNNEILNYISFTDEIDFNMLQNNIIEYCKSVDVDSTSKNEFFKFVGIEQGEQKYDN